MVQEPELKATFMRGSGVVCAYIPPRHSGAGYANFRHEYSIYSVRARECGACVRACVRRLSATAGVNGCCPGVLELPLR